MVHFTGSNWRAPVEVVVDNAGNAAATTTSSTLTELTWSEDQGIPLVLSDSRTDDVYGPGDTPVEQVDLATGAVTYLSYTPTDGTWVSTDATGDLTGFWGYDAFGSLAYGTPTSSLGFAGQMTDAPTGLTDLRARLYEPGTGTFSTRDPDFAATDAAYGYAGEDPVNLTDPLGLGILGDIVNFGISATETAVRISSDAYQYADNSWHQINSSWDCLNDACYANRKGFANLVAGGHNYLNYTAGLPCVPIPYPCTDVGAFFLGGNGTAALFYLPAGGISDFEFFDAAEGGTDGTADGVKVIESSGRTFVSTPRGTVYDIPNGWVGRTADNGRGVLFQEPGSVGNANSIRIMEPTAQYPDGYVRVYNGQGAGQPIDVNGTPGPPSTTHISQTYQGPWPAWP